MTTMLVMVVRRTMVSTMALSMMMAMLLSKYWCFPRTITPKAFGQYLVRISCPGLLWASFRWKKQTLKIFTKCVGMFNNCETQHPASITGCIFNVCWFIRRPASVTPLLISTIWCFRPYKPYIFCEDMIQATCLVIVYYWLFTQGRVSTS